MNAIATSARLVRTPLQAAARRQYSTGPSNGTPKSALRAPKKSSLAPLSFSVEAPKTSKVTRILAPVD
ncbi:hypothetical protein BGZ72_002158 [Mortierella alpina]|nr:hypothetical protein BGZ72_002158 [Mortierella alpina]